MIMLNTMVLLSLLPDLVFASGNPPAKGEILPAIKLPVPTDPDEKSYLGVSGGNVFRIPQIKATVVVIEIFSLYCPQCQAFAPEVNVLYTMIAQVPEFKEQIKLIGIGAGNSPLEVETFKKSNKVPFPLFPDGDFTIHKLLGEVRTPYFIVIKINRERSHEVIYSELGAFGEAETFLQRILKDSGLKQGN
jgi:thiol-disulfide isomerase/thioredoxin